MLEYYGSYDTEDWSNYAETSAFHKYIFKY